jgi:hypothetical protein
MAGFRHWYSHRTSFAVFRRGRESDVVGGGDGSGTEDGGCERKGRRWVSFGFSNISLVVFFLVVRRICIGETEFGAGTW